MSKSIYTYINTTACTHSTYEKSNIPISYTCCAYSVKKPIGELNLKRALDEETGPGVFSFFFSSLSSSSKLAMDHV